MKNCTDECVILHYYHFLGKQWSYPILFHMRESVTYSFEKLIYITNRKMSRSMLLSFLKEALALKLLEKKEDGYTLSALGVELKESYLLTKKALVKYHPDIYKHCIMRSRVDKKRVE